MSTRVAKTAIDPMTCRTPSLFYRSAREGMSDLLVHMKRRKPDLRVLLPSFIGWSPQEGSGVLDPVRTLELNADFYEVDGDDLSLRMSSLERQLNGAAFDLMIVIHYFGRTHPQLEEVASSVRNAGAILVEDLAHSFFSMHNGAEAGRHGSVDLFSLHKLLPTPGGSGGMVTYRDPSLLTGQVQTAPGLASFILDYDWKAIARARRRNFAELTERLADLPENNQEFELMWPVLDSKDVPQTLPVRIKNGRRDAIYHGMNDAGFGMVSLYHTLVDEVRTFSASVELSQRIINFPVHQDVDESQIHLMVEAFRSTLVSS